MLYTIEEVHQTPFLSTPVLNSTSTKMCIGKKINVLDLITSYEI